MQGISSSLSPAITNLLQDSKINKAIHEEKKKLLESPTTTGTSSPIGRNILSPPPSYDGFGAKEYIDWEIAIYKMFS